MADPIDNFGAKREGKCCSGRKTPAQISAPMRLRTRSSSRRSETLSYQSVVIRCSFPSFSRGQRKQMRSLPAAVVSIQAPIVRLPLPRGLMLASVPGQDPARVPDHMASGPELPADETVRRRFFGDE
jgi:hypothetical protein